MDEERLGGLQAEAEKLASQSQTLLEKDLPGVEGREELAQEAEGLLPRIDGIYSQSERSLWEPYVDVRTNIAMLFLRQGKAARAVEIAESTIIIIELSQRKTRERKRMPNYALFFENPVRGAKLFGVLVYALDRKDRRARHYGPWFRRIYKKLGEGPQDEVNEFLSKREVS